MNVIAFAGAVVVALKPSLGVSLREAATAAATDLALAVGWIPDLSRRQFELLFRKTSRILRKHWPYVERVAEALLERQTLAADEVRALGDRGRPRREPTDAAASSRPDTRQD